jgi:hypothetical protein
MPTAAERQIDALKPWLSSDEGGGEWRGFCLYCEDPKRSKTPSAMINVQKGVWHCMGKCGARGQVKTLVRKIRNGELPSNVVPLRESEDDEPEDDRPPLPDDAQITRWTKQLLAHEVMLCYLADKRGIHDRKLIKQLRLGYDRRTQRLTIPIYDEHGNLVNVRMYKRNAKQAAFKMISWARGWGEARLYGFDTLAAEDDVLLCEGEWDRIVALQNGLPAITHTGGAKVFKAEWAKHFKGKRVYFAYDEDESGRIGSTKASRMLEGKAEATYRVKLDTDIKGGDVTDFFLMGRTGAELRDRMKSAAKLYEREETHTVPRNGKPVSLVESQNPSQGDIEVTAMVVGKSQSYIAPKKLIGECTQSAGAKCNTCYFAANEGHREKEFTEDDPNLLQFMGASEERAKQRLYPKLLEANCTSHVTCWAPEEFVLEELLIAPSVEHRSEETETPIQRTVVSVGTYRTEANQLAKIVGRQRPHPSDQSAVIHSWHSEPVKSDIDNFEMSPAIMENLKRFKVARGQSPLEKCKEIADDLAANVTRIFGRPMLHVGYDLVWHSPIAFNFEGKQVTKGWLECLVIGDTRTGKSETAASLIKHYRAGVMRPLEGSSFAGLVGGAEQVGRSSWMVKWGIIPLNDRRLCVLDEMSGLFAAQGAQSKGIIEEMSSIRSEGKAQIQKMGSNETSARTRLIWISNPLDGSTSLSSSYNGCISALHDLVRNPEDIARFDFVMAAAQNDVDTKVINSPRHRRVKHRYTAASCSQLVMWAWSRKAEHIVFGDGVEDLIYEMAEDLGSRYIEDPPLVQTANARLKIARLAVAIAMRVFSSDSRGERVIVRKSHVLSAIHFLDEVYGHPAMGYQAHSERIRRNEQKAEESMKEARKYLAKPAQENAVRVLAMLGGSPFKHHDFVEMGSMDEDEARILISQLAMWGMVKSYGRYHQKKATPQLLRLVKELEEG